MSMTDRVGLVLGRSPLQSEEDLDEELARVTDAISEAADRLGAELGIPALAYGAGGLDVSHSPDEFIDEAAMRRCEAAHALCAGELLE
jgi:acetylornithine deacetylase/succinyl-diaminopimelate desuccinylase-like protein